MQIKNMKWIALLLILGAFTARGEDINDVIYASDKRVWCSAFKPDYRFVEGCRGPCGLPWEAFAKLVAVQGKSEIVLNTCTSLVDFVTITNAQQAIDFVRLFSSRQTHYLFDDAKYLEFPPYDKSLFWTDFKSIRRAREAGIPLGNPPVEVIQTNGAYRITRYVIDWHRNILSLEETVGTNGTYTITNRKILLRDVWASMPTYE